MAVTLTVTFTVDTAQLDASDREDAIGACEFAGFPSSDPENVAWFAVTNQLDDLPDGITAEIVP